MKFTKGNTYGNKSSRQGIGNKIDKESLIELVNLCTQDLKTNFDNLKTYEKIKLIVAFQNIYRDQLTEIQNQVGVMPEVIFIKTIESNESNPNL
jgi:hypothetical protein